MTVSMEPETISFSRTQVENAVQALVQVKSVIKSKKKTEPLLGDVEKVNLQFALKKVVTSKLTIKLKLPNGLEGVKKEVCLFVKDLDRSDREHEKSTRHFKQKLKEEGITCVSQIIPLKALKLEYKPFEAKRKLSDSYDVFLADARIIRRLPDFLGKAFYAKKRQPVQVRMDSKDLREEFETAISNSRCVFSGKGSVGMATVGSTDMSAAELVQNISACIVQIAAAIPGGAVNIRNMYIKTEDSMAIPVYLSFGSSNEVKLPSAKDEPPPAVVDEVTTVENALVKVYTSGQVKLVDKTTGKVKNVAKAVKKVGKRSVKRVGKKDVKRMGKKGVKDAKKEKGKPKPKDILKKKKKVK